MADFWDRLRIGLAISPIAGNRNGATLDSVDFATVHPRHPTAQFVDATVVRENSGPRFAADLNLRFLVGGGRKWNYSLLVEGDTAFHKMEDWRAYETAEAGLQFNLQAFFVALMGGPAFVIGGGPKEGEKVGGTGKLRLGVEIPTDSFVHPVIAFEAGGLFVGRNGPEVTAYYGVCDVTDYGYHGGRTCYTTTHRLDNSGGFVGLLVGVVLDPSKIN
ncbi:MAG: hypothetical protein HYS22_06060 [Deltaproteobacteria bacterium]|nr:hypothetical protein [Deltaproteobacteria bacterium]